MTDEAERAGRVRAEYRTLNERGVWVAATRHSPLAKRTEATERASQTPMPGDALSCRPPQRRCLPRNSYVSGGVAPANVTVRSGDWNCAALARFCLGC